MNNNPVNIAIVGAGGLVGRTMLKVLEERNFPVANIKLLASARSAGTILTFKDKELIIEEISDSSFEDVNIALFSAGKDVSINYAPIAVASKCVVIDNGSYWRMNEKVPLVVPEVNPEDAERHTGIIANPNCSTIQLAVALKPIYDNFGINRLVVSTYQSISGAGQKGLDKLNSELQNSDFIHGSGKHRIAFNTIFHEITEESGNSVEEIKMMNELRKILHNEDLRISVTCVRLPILGGHGESVNLVTEKHFELEDLRDVLRKFQGIILADDPINETYPTVSASDGHDEVTVGRLRIDESVTHGLNMWITADNLRKGAATNAVQIAEIVQTKNLFNY
ncbi:MAG: aspartate-semialdehyde dehydrogenase [Candidatus Kapabacteria bacterium]|nr:aspartate-semialdehyde dehydrogenase [Candidatus Kapabacteria bacterium]